MLGGRRKATPNDDARPVGVRCPVRGRVVRRPGLDAAMSRQNGKFRCVPDWPEMVLRAMPGTMRELALRTDTPKGTLKNWVLALRKAGWAHVIAWENVTPGKQRPVVQAGPGKDKPCPPTLTPAQQSKLFRDRARADGRYELILRRQHAKRKAERIRKSGRKATPFDALMK